MKSIIAVEIARKNSALIESLNSMPGYTFAYFDNFEAIPEPVLQNCQALLVSIQQHLTAKQINSMPALEYIGVYGSNKKNIDANACCKRKITLTNVIEYSDDETADFVVRQVKKYLPNERASIGIVGLGHVGQALAKQLLQNDYKVNYYSRSRKVEFESKFALGYLDSVSKLITQSQCICICVPPQVMAIHKDDLEGLNERKILINVSIGPNVDEQSFCQYLERTNSVAVFDKIAQRALKDASKSKQLILNEEYAWQQPSSQAKLDQKMLANLKKYLGKPNTFPCSQAPTGH